MPPERLLTPSRQEASASSVPGSKLRRATVVDIDSAGVVWRGPEYPVLAPGKYLVRGSKIQGPVWLRNYKRWSLRVEFGLIYEPVSVSMFFNLGNSPEKHHIGKQSKFFKAWTIANGDLPRRGQRMNFDIFLDGQIFEVMVQPCRTDAEGGIKAEAEQYARVEKIVSVTR